MNNNRISKKRISPANVLGRVIVWLYALVLLIPLYFVIVTAFKTGAEITMNPLGLPENLQWVNFINAFQEGSILRSALNSIVTSVIGVGLLLINAVVLSFCCHRLRNQKIGTILYMIILAGLFIPKVGFVSQVILYRRPHIYDTPLAIILGAAVGNIPFSVFILAGFLRTVPRAGSGHQAGAGHGRNFFVLRNVEQRHRPASLYPKREILHHPRDAAAEFYKHLYDKIRAAVCGRSRHNASGGDRVYFLSETDR